jgi:hypothetical protein
MPFQIHRDRLGGSNPTQLLILIDATRQVELFQQFPVSETGAIGMRYADHVWINAVWLPTISFTMNGAFHEWLEVVPRIGYVGRQYLSRRDLWRDRVNTSVLAEVLAERIDRGELTEEHARQIGKNILWDNALELYPRLKERL